MSLAFELSQTDKKWLEEVWDHAMSDFQVSLQVKTADPILFDAKINETNVSSDVQDTDDCDCDKIFATLSPQIQSILAAKWSKHFPDPGGSFDLEMFESFEDYFFY